MYYGNYTPRGTAAASPRLIPHGQQQQPPYSSGANSFATFKHSSMSSVPMATEIETPRSQSLRGDWQPQQMGINVPPNNVNGIRPASLRGDPGSPVRGAVNRSSNVGRPISPPSNASRSASMSPRRMNAVRTVNQLPVSVTNPVQQQQQQRQIAPTNRIETPQWQNFFSNLSVGNPNRNESVGSVRSVQPNPKAHASPRNADNRFCYHDSGSKDSAHNKSTGPTVQFMTHPTERAVNNGSSARSSAAPSPRLAASFGQTAAITSSSPSLSTSAEHKAHKSDNRFCYHDSNPKSAHSSSAGSTNRGDSSTASSTSSFYSSAASENLHRNPPGVPARVGGDESFRAHLMQIYQNISNSGDKPVEMVYVEPYPTPLPPPSPDLPPVLPRRETSTQSRDFSPSQFSLSRDSGPNFVYGGVGGKSVLEVSGGTSILAGDTPSLPHTSLYPDDHFHLNFSSRVGELEIELKEAREREDALLRRAQDAEHALDQTRTRANSDSQMPRLLFEIAKIRTSLDRMLSGERGGESNVNMQSQIALWRDIEHKVSTESEHRQIERENLEARIVRIEEQLNVSLRRERRQTERSAKLDEQNKFLTVSLKTDRQNFAREMALLKDKLVAETSAVAAAQIKIDELHSVIQLNKSKTGEEQRSSAELSDEIVALKSELDFANQRVRAAEERTQRSEVQISNLKNRVAEAEESEVAMQKSNEVALAAMEQRVFEFSAETDRLRRARENDAELWRGAEEKLKQLSENSQKHEVNDLKRQVTDLRHQIESRDSEIRKLRESLDSQKKQLNETQEFEFSKMREARDLAIETASRLRDDRSAAATQIETLREKISQLETKSQRSSNDGDTLRFQSKIRDLSQQVDSLNSQLQSARASAGTSQRNLGVDKERLQVRLHAAREALVAFESGEDGGEGIRRHVGRLSGELAALIMLVERIISDEDKPSSVTVPGLALPTRPPSSSDFLQPSLTPRGERPPLPPRDSSTSSNSSASYSHTSSASQHQLPPASTPANSDAPNPSLLRQMHLKRINKLMAGSSGTSTTQNYGDSLEQDSDQHDAGGDAGNGEVWVI